MSDGKQFPQQFFSKAPLKENLNVIKLGDANQQQLYWLLSVQKDAVDEPFASSRRLAPYDDNENDLVDCCDLEDNYEICPTKSGKYITSFYVPSSLHSVIVGPRGSKLRELQENTRTLIKVPKIGENDNIVKITGHNERSVSSARTQIAIIVLAKRERLPITHFVSIPMYSNEIADNFRKFKSMILSGPSTRGIDDTIFQKPEKLHLTIVALTLLDQREIDEARDVLRGDVLRLITKLFAEAGKTPKQIRLEGIEIMNDDPSDVNVLYGKITLINNDNNDRTLQTLVNEIFDYFYRNGLVKKQFDDVKLHVTLMNSLFRKKVDDYERLLDGTKELKRESFDASDILDKYRDFYFGTCTFRDIQLSIRFTNKNNYYESAETVLL